MPHKLGLVTTHPIQYHSAWFRALASHPEVDLNVFFCHRVTPAEQATAGFGVEFEWDISLLDGYNYRFLKNRSSNPSIHNFEGLDTPEICDLIKHERYDAVLVNGWHYRSAWQAIRACWSTKTPVMVRSDSHLLTKRSRIKRLGKWPFYRWFIPKLDACLPVGNWSRDYFIHYGAAPESIFVVPHAVDCDHFQRESERLKPLRNSLRAKWGFNIESNVYMFAGKFVEKKRPFDFARAIGQAAGAEAPIVGLMVGDGPLRKSCQEFVDRNRIPIKFSGFLNQSEMPQSYIAADALVLPSDSGETWGLVVNEAMACGRPCFVSDQVGCGPDLILTGKTGQVFPLGDTQALAQILSSLTKKQLEDMGRNAASLSCEGPVDTAVGSVLRAIRYVTKGNIVN